MGNTSSSSCNLFKTCLISSSSSPSLNHKKVVEIFNSIDSKVMKTFNSPISVKDAIDRIIISSSSNEIFGLSKEPGSESLRPDYELKVGTVYHAVVVPRVSKRVKVVVTKQQLRELLEQRISLEEVVLLGLENDKNTNIKSVERLFSVEDRFFMNRRSKLESIPEEIE